MVELLNFLSSECDSNWELHLECFKEISTMTVLSIITNTFLGELSVQLIYVTITINTS